MRKVFNSIQFLSPGNLFFQTLMGATRTATRHPVESIAVKRKLLLNFAKETHRTPVGENFYSSVIIFYRSQPCPHILTIGTTV